MLLTKQQVVAAMQLTPAEIKALLFNEGYTDIEFRSVQFTGMTDNLIFVYFATFISTEVDAGYETGNIYVKYKRRCSTVQLKLTADF
jgi:hypothetical protein